MKFFIYGEVLNACQTHSKRWVMAFYRLLITEANGRIQKRGVIGLNDQALFLP